MIFSGAGTHRDTLQQDPGRQLQAEEGVRAEDSGRSRHRDQLRPQPHRSSPGETAERLRIIQVRLRATAPPPLVSMLDV